ncbi:ATP-binding cassette domain-containing protein [Synechococcus sp. H60.2]|uniref:ABC transporter ATP-binding protein n=1 Tax=Synechococcus sp. H60.2 TaxID=2964518 RepID=UPI0039C23BF9
MSSDVPIRLEPIIVARDLSKVYPVAIKEAGVVGTLRHFFRRTYHYIAAVQSMSFQIQPGEVVGFLGPNGAGKTTTLKMLAGLIYPSGGTLQVVGHVPYRREPSFLRQITLVMGQKQQLIWDLPAIDSLRINAAVYEIPEKEFRERVGELAELLDLQGKLKQPVRKLSLGERMKAELLAALIHRPQILFLDEPTLGLDVNAQAAVRQFLRDYNRRYGATVLLTSHYMADITALCERVLVISAGQLIYDGGLEELRQRFAPYREVKLELARPCPLAQLQVYGELRSEGDPGSSCEVRLWVRREHLTQTVAQLLADLEVLDLTVTDPPIEEVIRRVFAEGIPAARS